MVEFSTVPVELSIKRNSFSPVRNVSVGAANIPAVAPSIVDVNVPIEYVDVASGVVVHVPVI